MGRILRSFFLCLCFAVFVPLAQGESVSSPELDSVLQKMEARNNRWIAIRADVLVFFAGVGNSRALCSGELLYQRLDERMLLSCSDTQKELVFLFRTFDRRFDLYLPAQKTVYHGTIFDMEDSPEIESHLKARDLYRALKPLAVDPRRAKIERTNFAITNLDVYSERGAAGELLRKLYLTPEGDVRGELFYNAEKRPATEIQRYDFREIPGQVGAFSSIIYPKKITIASSETKKGSAIFFTRVKALDAIDPLEFILRIPPGTQEVFIEEKSPRFAAQAPAKESVPAQIAQPTAQPPTPSRVKNVPQEPSPTAPQQPEKLPPPAPPQQIEKKTESPTPAMPPPETSEKKESPVEKNTDVADIVVEEPLPGNDPMNSLDPSVEPSLEMGENPSKGGKT